jgi:ketosteroid isomerase-like protein
MRSNSLGLAMLLLGALGACSASDVPQTAVSGPCLLPDEDISAIQILEARHRDQAASQDFDAMAEEIGEDFFAWAPNQPEIAGKSQLREWQRAWEGVSFSTYELPVDEIIGCGDLAFVKGSYTMEFTPEGSNEPISDTGRWIHLLRKSPDGRWLVIRDMFHSELPAPTG